MHYFIITTSRDLSKTNHCCEFWENKSKPFELNVWDCFSQAMPDSIILHKIWHSNSVVPKYCIIFYYYLYGVRPVGCVLCDKLGSRCNKCISCPIFCEGISNQWCFYSFYWNHMIILFCYKQQFVAFPFFSPVLSDFIPLHDACTSCLFGFAHEYDSLICCPLFHLQLLTLTQRERR